MMLAAREGRHRRLGVGFWEPTDHLDQEPKRNQEGRETRV
jgi:hypothetical protein